MKILEVTYFGAPPYLFNALRNTFALLGCFSLILQRKPCNLLREYDYERALVEFYITPIYQKTLPILLRVFIKLFYPESMLVVIKKNLAT